MSKYIDLVEKLPKEEKFTLAEYIFKYGCPKDTFIGVDEWLQNWSHANQKLYKLLGNQFIVKFPFEYSKSHELLAKEIYNLCEVENNYNNKESFLNNYSEFCFNFLEKYEKELELDHDTIHKIRRILIPAHLTDNKIPYTIKYKRPNGKKILQIQTGAKPFRAVNQIINYFKDDYKFDLKALDRFRQRHAIIFSEKTIKGNVCISIHPMDFLTMSDNNSNWSSCMSWEDNGCYHVGTIEMMNSNNVLCCYLENSSPFVFDKDKINPETGEIIGIWNNKRWRSLFYITKDIIMSGKPYPYASLELTNEILNHIHDLAKDNLDWNYQFGPERYKDMSYINSLYRMNVQRDWIAMKSFKKHNILWDTKGMYNDMLNDPSTVYMCYRNKVEHTKIISISGKANCLCCNNKILHHDENAEDYNERYYDTSTVICHNCISKNFKCEYCYEENPKLKLIRTKQGNICNKCFENKIRRCPCCGEIFYIQNSINNLYNNPALYKDITIGTLSFEKMLEYLKNGVYLIRPGISMNDYIPQDVDKMLNDKYDTRRIDGNKVPVLEELYCCKKCSKKLIETLTTPSISYHFTRKRYWSNTPEQYYLVDPAKVEKYRYFNLKTVSLEEFERGPVMI